MIVLFAGPSLAGFPTPDFDRRGPAQQGDLTQAVLDGAKVIGLIDGIFEHCPAVWHKEILYALSEGVAVFGAASMGALRAAECAPFGMVGVGRVFALYRSGVLEDDDAVAQLHAPAEFDHAPLTEALVNVRATLWQLRRAGRISRSEARAVVAAAQKLFFKDRTLPQIVSSSDIPDAAHKRDILAALQHERFDLKRSDAAELVRLLRCCSHPLPNKHRWELARTPMFLTILQRLSNGAGLPDKL